MAVVATPAGSTLVVAYQAGISPDGAPIRKQKTLSHIRSDASEQAVYAAAQALFSLTQYPVETISFRQFFTLSDV
ncbi:MAG: DUF1659 domain-containing protein [Peptococcaceae bacterium]|jgi:hypothetical protein|nr:DUF1659 domain-containing protein [Peptococcaceae bacterium]